MPIGEILVFVSIVIIALKMIVNSSNANKRSESIGALAWVCAGTMFLGLSLVVSGIILSIATNGGGALITGGSTNGEEKDDAHTVVYTKTPDIDKELPKTGMDN